MTVEHISAVRAMNALRIEIEDRLSQIEDYRVLKALEVAIASVLSPSANKINNLAAIMNALTNPATVDTSRPQKAA